MTVSTLTHASEHFTWLELACHDGTPVPVKLRPNAERLCGALELIRARWGGPVVVISGYRTKLYNLRVGGALASQHCQATAADVRPVSLGAMPQFRSMVEFMIGADQLPTVGGYGAYPGWVHVDVRPRAKGRVARWEGAGVGSEPG